MADSGGTQAEVIRFLATAIAGGGAGPEVVETHGAIVVLGADAALKIKRAVKLAYLDFSTLRRREAACRREIEVNRANAPEIYRDAVAVTREADGSLALGGRGVAVEWAVRMARFPEADVLSSVATARGIGDDLARALARMVIAAHERAERRPGADVVAALDQVIASIGASFAGAAEPLQSRAGELVRVARAALGQNAALLVERAAGGLVRRCHGDMHLGNIVLWKGEPTLFDAIEFDETLATVDVLYDLAFLVMDLERRGERRAAHIVLDGYLAGAGEDANFRGLAALPLFLGLRAAVRAMVAFDRAKIQAEAERAATLAHAAETLARAVAHLRPARARLVAVGGLSGTGKSTLAAALAPDVMPSPGAVHLRSDVIRKQLAGVGELERLAPASYTAEASARVYARLGDLARLALGAGHSVIADAVFADSAERDAIEALAKAAGVGFTGLWLEARTETLSARVTSRRGDASDADAAVVAKQASRNVGPVAWQRLEAGGEAGVVTSAARAVLGLA